MVTFENNGITFDEEDIVARVEWDFSQALEQIKELENHLLSALTN